LPCAGVEKVAGAGPPGGKEGEPAAPATATSRVIPQNNAAMTTTMDMNPGTGFFLKDTPRFVVIQVPQIEIWIQYLKRYGNIPDRSQQYSRMRPCRTYQIFFILSSYVTIQQSEGGMNSC
jgi:hypothetical protein